MLERFEGALESVKEATVLDMLIVAGLAATVLSITNNSVSLYQSIFGARRMNKLDLIAIASERESALTQLLEAGVELNSDALGGALETVNKAITDFERMLSRNPDVVELGNNKKLLAKLLYMRAQVKTLLNEPVQAELDLLKATTLHPGFILAHNLLSHLYLYQLHNQDKAKKSLATSASLNKHQVYAKFYLSMLNDDLSSMNATAEKILHVYFQQFEAEIKQKDQTTHPALKELLTSTPFITIPFILVNWLDIKIERENNPHELLIIANAIQAILNNNSAIRNTKLRVMMQECRISALMKIKEIKLPSSDLNEDERLLQLHISSSSLENESPLYHFEYSADYLDKAVTSLFNKGTETNYLSLPKYQSAVADVITGWAKQGMFRDDKNPNIMKLVALLIESNSNPENDTLSSKISAIAKSQEVINYFIANYINGKGWKPWLTVVPAGNNLLSLLLIACKEQNVALAVYHRSKDNEKSLELKGPLNQFQAPALRLLYDEESSSQHQFKLLQTISTPSDLYCWMALSECWQLLKHDDPYNAYALSLLGERQLATLPQYVQMKHSHSINQQETDALIGGLDAYIQHHDGVCQDDKIEAERIRATYPQKKQSSNYNKFFAAIGATAVTLGVAYALTRNNN